MVNGQSSSSVMNFKRKEAIILVCLMSFIVMMGAYLRLSNLGKPCFVDDEFLHVYGAQSVLDTGKATLPSGRNYNRALPYTLIVAFFSKTLGMNEWSARLPSVLFGVISIVMIFFVGSSLFVPAVGLIAAFLLAFLPLEIAWSRECRFYAMYQFFYLTGFFAMFKALEKSASNIEGAYIFQTDSLSFTTFSEFVSGLHLDFKWLFVALAALYIAFKLQVLTVLFFGSLWIYLFVMFVVDWVNRGFRQAVGTKYFLLSTLIAVCSLLFLAFVDFWALWEEMTTALPWARTSRRDLLRYVKFLGAYELFPLGAFFFLGIISILLKMQKVGFYIVVFSIVPLLAHGFLASFGTIRYIYDIFPLIILICSYFAYDFVCRILYVDLTLPDSVDSQLSSRGYLVRNSLRISVIVLFVAFCTLASPWFRSSFKITKYLTSDLARSIGGRVHPNFRESCKYIEAHTEEDQIIIASTPLASLYYCGKVDYRLNNGSFYDITDANKEYYCPQTNVKSIVNIDQLKSLFETYGHIWLLLDYEKWVNENDIPLNIKQYIENMCQEQAIDSNDTIYLFKCK